MTWEPLPLEIAEWMGMDDDQLRIEQSVHGRGPAMAASAANHQDSAAA